MERRRSWDFSLSHHYSRSRFRCEYSMTLREDWRWVRDHIIVCLLTYLYPEDWVRLLFRYVSSHAANKNVHEISIQPNVVSKELFLWHTRTHDQWPASCKLTITYWPNRYTGKVKLSNISLLLLLTLKCLGINYGLLVARNYIYIATKYEDPFCFFPLLNF